ncbi:MAG: SURF1 family protein [Rhizobiaceae bacterium]|nr:SURF1 family protein [Rhizobiaceae bacterium]
MINRSNLILLTCMALGLAVLISLGTWQVKRLHWKEALIETIDQRIASDPKRLSELSKSGLEKDTQEYQPVSVTGEFDHSSEVYFFTTGKGGASGWNVHTPLLMDGGTRVIVNRGFVPFDLKNPDKRPQGLVEGPQRVEALLRFPLNERPLGSLDNSPETKEFYWRNVSEMASAMKGETEKYLPVILDQLEAEIPGMWPKGGTTITDFPNNHLQYAVTWYGLALTLLGVGGYFLFSRRRAENDE